MRRGQPITRSEVLRRQENGYGILVHGPGQQPAVYEPNTIDTSEVVVAAGNEYWIRAREDLVEDPNGKSVHFVDAPDIQFFLTKLVRIQEITEDKMRQMQQDGVGMILHDPPNSIFLYSPSKTDGSQVVVVSGDAFFIRDVEALEMDEDCQGVHFVDTPGLSYAFYS